VRQALVFEPQDFHLALDEGLGVMVAFEGDGREVVLGERDARHGRISTWLLRLACVLSGLGVALDGALLLSTGHAAHAACGVIFFALGAAGVGLQGWHAVKRLQVGGWFKTCYGRAGTQRRGR
jgi:hypothetical protein